MTALTAQPWFDREGYPFQPHAFDLAGVKMHYVDEGSGPVVLLLHGTPGWSYEYRELIEQLSKTHRCIAPDMIGFGLSDKPADWGYTLEHHTESLKALVAHLGLQKFDLVVHDFAGPVGLPLALEHPEMIRRLVLMNTWMWPLTINEEFAKQKGIVGLPPMRWLYLYWNFSARMMVKMSWGTHRKLTPLRHRHFLAAFPDAASRHGTYGFLRSTIDRDDYLEGLWAQRPRLQSIPTQVVWGLGDKFVTDIHLKRWKEVLPKAEFVELQNVGHFPHDEAPELVVPKVDAFLR
jgi:haloalkane dehalogenase